jgi:hypothetical protein
MSKVVSLLAVVGLAAAANAAIVIVPTNTAFTNIAATGTSPGTSSDDAEFNVTGAALLAAGFAGNELLGAVNIRIGNNGGVLWGATTGEVGYVNRNDFMTMAGANGGDTGNGGTIGAQFVASLWDDNTPATGQGANALDWQVINGNLIIQWTNEDHFNAAGTGTISHQMIVYGGVTIASGQKLVEFVYDDTLYGTNLYQNDGGSATIGFKNWGINANANDVEFGVGGGTNSLSDPAFNGTNMQPKVGGWSASSNAQLTHSVAIIPAPGALALLGLGGLLAGRRRR